MASAAFAYRSGGGASSDSDSDDSDKESRDWKRASHRTVDDEDLEKIPMAPTTVPTAISSANGTKKKRNNIWCEVLQDQIISDTLVECGLKNKPANYGSRGPESYDYTLSESYKKRKQDFENKMSEDEVSDADSTSPEPVKNNKKVKTDYQRHPRLDPIELGAARKIIKVLAEPKHYIIYRIVKFIGVEKAMKLLKETEEIEDNGGMMINNQQRRRTPGGVYLQLLKGDASIGKEVIDKVFEGEMNSYERKKMLKEEKKKKLKLFQAKKKLMKQLNNVKPIDAVEMEDNDNDPKPTDDAMEMEEITVQKDTVHDHVEEKANTSDLEDGEIGD